VSINWGEAALSGIASGASAVGQQYQQQQNDQEWLQRQQALQKMELDTAKQKEEYLLSIEPPKTQTSHALQGDTIMDQGQQWVKDPKTGTFGWQDFGTAVPNANQANLEEKTRHNQESEALREATATASAQARQAQLALGEERLNMAAERAKAAGTRDKGFDFTDYANADPEKRALYDRFRRGEEDPNQKADLEARAATLKELDGTNPSDTDRANTLYRNQVTMGADPFKSVKPGASTTAKPMSQFAGPAKAAPHPIGPEVPVSGRHAPQGPDGRTYVVQNGVPVPQ
jgi:hypothetical protein